MAIPVSYTNPVSLPPVPLTYDLGEHVLLVNPQPSLAIELIDKASDHGESLDGEEAYKLLITLQALFADLEH